MKRSRIVFIAVVFGLLTFGILRERGRPDDPGGAHLFSAGPAPNFETLELPVGERVLRGEVRDHAGEPAEGVQILLFRAEALADRAEPVKVAFTDAEGRFELDELFATEYGIVLALHGVEPRTETITVPETPLVTEAAFVLTPPLEPLEVLPEIDRADLVGRIVPLGPPAPTVLEPVDLRDYEVAVRPKDTNHPLGGAVVRRTLTDERGSFRFEGLVAADYDLELYPHWAQGGSWPVLDRVELTHTPDGTEGAELVVRSGSIEGRLVDLDQRPVEGALDQDLAGGGPAPDLAGRAVGRRRALRADGSSRRELPAARSGRRRRARSVGGGAHRGDRAAPVRAAGPAPSRADQPALTKAPSRLLY